MNLNQFKSQISEKGLSRNNRWSCRVFPPQGLSGLSNIFRASSRGLDLAVEVPGVDLVNRGIEQLNNLQLNLPGISIGHNLNIPTLGYILNNTGSLNENIDLYCNSVQLPGRDLQNLEWREYGESRALGFVHTHKPVNISYYCSEDMIERSFFEQWQDLAFDHQSKRRSYYQDYVSKVEISKWNAGWTRQTALYRLVEAYPTNVSAQTLVYEEASIMRLDVTMRFRYYERLK